MISFFPYEGESLLPVVFLRVHPSYVSEKQFVFVLFSPLGSSSMRGKADLMGMNSRLFMGCN